MMFDNREWSCSMRTQLKFRQMEAKGKAVIESTNELVKRVQELVHKIEVYQMGVNGANLMVCKSPIANTQAEGAIENGDAILVPMIEIQNPNEG